MYTQKVISKDSSIITIGLVKKYLRIDNDAEDEIISICMNNALEYIQEQHGIVICGTLNNIEIEDFSSNTISLKTKPILEVKSIKINNVLLDESSYKIIDEKTIQLSSFAFGKVELIVKFGYKNISEIPAKLQNAFLQITSHVYQNKNGWNSKMPRSVLEMNKDFQKIKV